MSELVDVFGSFLGGVEVPLKGISQSKQGVITLVQIFVDWVEIVGSVAGIDETNSVEVD